MVNNCKHCNIELTSSNRAGGKNDYLCKQCLKKYSQKHYQANKERYNKNSKARHKERMETDPEYRNNRNEKNKQYRKDNPDYHNQYYADNPERCKKIRDKHRAKPETKVLRMVHTRNRQAKLLNATPAWANQGYIRLFYEGAKIEEKRTGRKVHVDHIVPLQGENVCGLHCEDNLQLLFAKDNQVKRNSHTN